MKQRKKQKQMILSLIIHDSSLSGVTYFLFLQKKDLIFKPSCYFENKLVGGKIVIVNPTREGWEIIYHRAHALLAAQIAGQWRKQDAPLKLYQTIAAISHHDDLEKEWEENCLTPGGAPMDFTFDFETSYHKLRKHMESALYRGRWVALLNSMHMSRLNENQRSSSVEADKFLDEQIRNQKIWREELGVSTEDAQKAYDFMQWCDRLSLILCQKELPADERLLEISKAHDGIRYDIQELADGCVTVIPWCFESDRFNVDVEASYLNQVKFNDNASLIAALQKAPRQQLQWTFVKPPKSDATKIS